MFKNAQSTEHGKDEKLMRHAVPPAEARAPRNNFLRAFAAEALEELVDHEAAGRPGEAALAVELPPLRFEEGHGLSGGGGAAKTQQKRSRADACRWRRLSCFFAGFVIRDER